MNLSKEQQSESIFSRCTTFWRFIRAVHLNCYLYTDKYIGNYFEYRFKYSPLVGTDRPVCRFEFVGAAAVM